MVCNICEEGLRKFLSVPRVYYLQYSFPTRVYVTYRMDKNGKHYQFCFNLNALKDSVTRKFHYKSLLNFLNNSATSEKEINTDFWRELKKYENLYAIVKD